MFGPVMIRHVPQSWSNTKSEAVDEETHTKGGKVMTHTPVMCATKKKKNVLLTSIQYHALRS